MQFQEKEKMQRLKESLGNHLGQMKMGIMLFAKTFGARRIVSEEYIWPFCLLCLLGPFVLLMLSIMYEGYYLKQLKLKKEKEKAMAVKKNK